MHLPEAKAGTRCFLTPESMNYYPADENGGSLILSWGVNIRSWLSPTTSGDMGHKGNKDVLHLGHRAGTLVLRASQTADHKNTPQHGHWAWLMHYFLKLDTF